MRWRSALFMNQSAISVTGESGVKNVESAERKPMVKCQVEGLDRVVELACGVDPKAEVDVWRSRVDVALQRPVGHIDVQNHAGADRHAAYRRKGHQSRARAAEIGVA